ncbi:hypothetical protein C2845_PM09G19870 [Panicum miliaceum]|uniref:BZIP domain-containing protein n=1 Tax=Panicum miliaceum TaxID=4540 RepID=A0A3L6RZN5_PANMI|nr:hypothetical protein C2845_PM09G19870 [Panicum miliaceum]
MTAVDAEPYAVVATAADIICSLRGADLAGWTPPWRKGSGAPDLPSACADAGAGQEEQGGGDDARGLAWPAVARGKRSRSRRAGSPSASGSASVSAGAAAVASKEDGRRKKPRRGARGSPASPLDYSGSGASTSGGEDGAFCSQPAAPAPPAAAPPSSKVGGGLAGRRSILPVPPPRPAGQRPRKKMRLPEIQQLVRSLSVENDALREEMKALQTACTALCKENGKLETRLDHSSKWNGMISAENKGKPQHDHERAAEQDAPNGFVLPDLNLPADN